MRFKLLFILSVIFCSPSFSQSEDIGDGQDTLIFRDGTKLAVHLVEVGRQVIAYKTDQSAEEIKYTSFYTVKEVRQGNGDVKIGGEAFIYTIPLGQARANSRNKFKRLGHLTIGSQLSTLLGMHEYRTPAVNATVHYFPISSISLGVSGYYSVSSSGPRAYVNGVDFSIGVSTSKYRKFDLGARLGVGFHTTRYDAIIGDQYYVYLEDSSSYYQFNGSTYRFDHSNTYIKDTISRMYSYRSVFFSVEGHYQILPQLSVSASIGLHGVPWMGYDPQTESTAYNQYFDYDGNFVGEEIMPSFYTENNIYYIYQRRRIRARFSVFYHINTKKKTQNVTKLH